MKIIEIATSNPKDVIIERVIDDYKAIKKAKFHFNWEKEKENLVFKLRLEGDDEILGLMSLKNYPSDKRFQINLLAVSNNNIGKEKQYDGIVGNLIAFACREAIKLYSENACVSLFPKTELRKHYVEKYNMIDFGGEQVFLEGNQLYKLLSKYEV